jgi:ADP-ribose pyrophosphatase
MIDIKFEEKENSFEQKFKGNILDVKKYTVTLPNNKTAFREVVEHPGAVAVFPIDFENNIYLVNQYRFPIRNNLIEIPAGKFDFINEDPLECGVRELKEETGITAKNWIKLGIIHTTPGFSNEILHLFLAKDLTFGHSNTDEDEFLEIYKINLIDFEEKIIKGEITDSKTICAYSIAKLQKLI